MHPIIQANGCESTYVQATDCRSKMATFVVRSGERIPNLLTFRFTNFKFTLYVELLLRGITDKAFSSITKGHSQL